MRTAMAKIGQAILTIQVVFLNHVYKMSNRRLSVLACLMRLHGFSLSCESNTYAQTSTLNCISPSTGDPKEAGLSYVCLSYVYESSTLVCSNHRRI